MEEGAVYIGVTIHSYYAVQFWHTSFLFEIEEHISSKFTLNERDIQTVLNLFTYYFILVLVRAKNRFSTSSFSSKSTDSKCIESPSCLRLVQ